MTTPPVDERREGLRPVLGLLQVTASGVGIIIGAGIYVLLGPATEQAGGTVWVAFLLLTGNGAGGVVGAAALVFFAFIGFDEVITLSEETRDPTRTVPRALLVALGLSALLYALVAIATVSVLGAAGVATSERPLADVVEQVTGQGGVTAMVVVALLTTTNTTLLSVTAASRVAFGMAERASLPPVLARVSRRGAPWTAILVVAAAGAAFVAVGDLTVIAGATDVAVYVVFLAVNAVVVLRIRRPDAPRPFRVPGSLGRVPVVPVVAPTGENTEAGYAYDPETVEFTLCVQTPSGAWATYDTEPMSLRQGAESGGCPELG